MLLGPSTLLIEYKEGDIVANTMLGAECLTEEIEALQSDFERAMNPQFGLSATQLSNELKACDTDISDAQQAVRKSEDRRREPLRRYEEMLADYAKTLPGKDPFYAASFYMDGRFDGTWESQARNSGDMFEYWHRRGMLLANLNAFLLEGVQPVFMIDVATTEMGGERNRPLTAATSPRGGVRNKFLAVFGHTQPDSPMEILEEFDLDATTGARISTPSKVLLNVEIDELFISDNWPTHNMGGRVPKAGIRTVDEAGLLRVPILEAPFPSIGSSANMSLATPLGGENIFGTTNVAIGAEHAERILQQTQDKYVNGVNHDEYTWASVARAAGSLGITG